MNINFDGLGVHLGNLYRLSNAKSRSISAENPTGEKGRAAMAEPDGNSPARELGRGWKVSPSAKVKAGETYTLAEIEGPGAIKHIWFGGYIGREFILRFYWDEQEHPSVECPLPDFFASGWANNEGRETGGPFAPLNSLPVVVNPMRGMNCFWEMPFRKKCIITVENIGLRDRTTFYQIDYVLTEVPEDAAYFHAQFRRSKPVRYMEEHVILDGVNSKGHYVGTAAAVGLNGANGWWGEGEIKFYLDGDRDYPTICTTGTEDYFGGSYNWEVNGKYFTYSTPFMGMYWVIQPDGLYISQQRFCMYRWHIPDPIRFENDIRVTMQDLGWRSVGRFLPRQDDIATVAYWYQILPTAPFPPLPNRNGLEIV